MSARILIVDDEPPIVDMLAYNLERANVVVEFEGLEPSDLYPQALPDLFQGSSLLLTGRYRATDSTVSVRVRGLAGDEWDMRRP